MTASFESQPVAIVACDCLTPFGDAAATAAALLDKQVALQLHPVLGRDGGDPVPLALIGGTMEEATAPRWLEPLRDLQRKIPNPPGAAAWGSARAPVLVTSSNFGVGSMYLFMRDHDPRHLRHGPPFAAVELLQREFGWGENVTVFSHACVTAHLGLAHAARLLHAALAEHVLVFSFDFVSPFVAGGFHSLKILNGALPAPFAVREVGAIGLGDGAAFAVLTPAGEAPDGREGCFRIEGHALFNEMFHFTSNQPDAAGFAACAGAVADAVRGRRVWVKGHGTGTLDAGRLEAETIARVFPDAPVVSWKGSLGHTLGSCGLVELAIATAAWRAPDRRIPGTVAGAQPSFSANVALEAFDAGAFDAAVLTSNAFGGAHAAMVLSYDPAAAGRAGSHAGEGSSPAVSPANVANTKRQAASRVRLVERYVRHLRVELPPLTETAAEARVRLADKFPRAALRRMTHLGLLLGTTLDGVVLRAEDALVYASHFAETRALEDFLASFPAASPLLFQTSIHPGGIQQVLIGRQQPIARLWPLAGRARLVEQALLTALLEPAPRVFILGGEERGTWLLEHNMASERSFAFALELTREPENAVARLTFAASAGAASELATEGSAPPALPALANALAERRTLAWQGQSGSWALDWC